MMLSWLSWVLLLMIKLCNYVKSGRGRKKNVVLTPDLLLREKNPVGRKSALNLLLLLCMYKCTIHFVLKFMCLCLGKKPKRCLMHVLMNGNTLYAYKKMCKSNNMLCKKEFWWIFQREIVANQTLKSVHKLPILYDGFLTMKFYFQSSCKEIIHIIMTTSSPLPCQRHRWKWF